MALDWVGPLDILNTLSRSESSKPSTIPSVECVIVGDSLTPISMSNGMKVTPKITYEVAQGRPWDAVLVPGGIGARPWFESNARCREFLVEVVPKCQFVFTGTAPNPSEERYTREEYKADLAVCTGSWLLSATGLLKGEKATCNKRAFASVLVSFAPIEV